MDTKTQKAISAFNQWVHKMRGPEMARNGNSSPEPDAMETKTVAEAVERFIELFPQFGKFRAQIHDSRKHPIRVASKLWSQSK